jgi:hypothetical protein
MMGTIRRLSRTVKGDFGLEPFQYAGPSRRLFSHRLRAITFSRDCIEPISGQYGTVFSFRPRR